MITDRSISRNDALGTVQFYLLWAILFINVTAGIGILAQTSPMVQDMFHKTPAEAGTIMFIISLFNAGGRFFWASCSDFIGRRNTYTLFFVVQFALFFSIPGMAARGDWTMFLTSLFIVFTMYGGGFATIPAFLADIFGPENVGAIHGAVLTAWSAAAVAGPTIITSLSNSAKAALAPGASRVHIYDKPLEVLAAGLGRGFRADAAGPAAKAPVVSIIHNPPRLASPLKSERRQQAQHRFVRAVDQQASLPRTLDKRTGRAVQLNPDHQTSSSNRAD